MDEQLQNRINSLVEGMIARLEHDIKNCPPEKFDSVAMTIMNLNVMKENINQGQSQLYAQQQLIKKISRKMDEGGNNFMFGTPPEQPA
jgi:hypothetical protein